MYNESDFTWLKPKHKSKLAVTIPNETDFNINAALAAELPEEIGIGYIEEAKILRYAGKKPLFPSRRAAK